MCSSLRRMKLQAIVVEERSAESRCDEGYTALGVESLPTDALFE